MASEITPLDPADEATVEAAQDLRVAVDAADTPDFPPPCPREFRAKLAHEGYARRTEWYVARSGGEVVGYLSLSLPLRDNLETADMTLLVHPARRRRGTGQALYEFAADRVRTLGRKWLTGASVITLPDGSSRDEAGRAFATAIGAKPALEEVRRRLDLTGLDEAAVSGMLAQARERSAGYQLVTWRDDTPEEFVADTGYLEGRLNSDAPIGELALEPEQVDLARIRNREEFLRAAGIRVYAAGAVHADSGRLVALTAIGGMATVPWYGSQWITLVDPDHRGHRLGALVKIENLRQTQQHEPDLQVIDTWNAAVNSHMISINEAMGFRPVDSWLMWQQEV